MPHILIFNKELPQDNASPGPGHLISLGYSRKNMITRHRAQFYSSLSKFPTHHLQQWCIFYFSAADAELGSVTQLFLSSPANLLLLSVI